MMRIGWLVADEIEKIGYYIGKHNILSQQDKST
jgi:hypothetical protein